MNYRVDFSISNRFRVVEQAVFRLACNGVLDIVLIKALLNIFSEQVIAIAIRNLVNAQLLQADLENGYQFLFSRSFIIFVDYRVVLFVFAPCSFHLRQHRTIRKARTELSV